VDIPALVFIVLLRPVKSRILWEQEDFDLTPLLEMRGGKAKAKKVFADLPQLVLELNEAVAAGVKHCERYVRILVERRRNDGSDA